MPVFDASFLNPKLREVHKDSETGCIYVGSSDTAYETCRQGFYIKQQTQLMKRGQLVTSNNDSEKAKQLESHNTDLEKITDQQNQQITQLIQELEKDSRQIATLNLTNIVLTGVLLITICVFFVLKFRKQR